MTPLLKKPNLDTNVLEHYRPVSNLHYVSKILEKVVAMQLSHHLHENNLLEPHQSAYRTAHSTETALVRVSNDILRAIDNKQSVFLVLLDMSSAFDTIDHSILLSMLNQRYAIGGTALIINGLHPICQTGPSRYAFWENHLSHNHWTSASLKGLCLDPYYSHCTLCLWLK